MTVAVADLAEAQVQPGGMGPMGGGQQPSGEEKKEGVAEAAPKTPGLLPTTPALPAPKGRRKRWKLLELDGYFRLRTDWFKNFNQNFIDDPALGGAPFARALSCGSGYLNHPCDSSIGGSNTRLRLEPTINIDEGTSVHIQADVLDNLVLGSTPSTQNYAGVYNDGTKPPTGAFGNTVDPVTQGGNSDRTSIVIKRAWAEVAVPLGVVTVGRMPNQWGMGMLYNGGGADPINGGYDYDADYGDTVDRAAFTAPIPGTNLRAMLAADWVTSGLASNQTTANLGHEGHPFDLDDSDDANGWVGVISKMDSPQEFKDTVDRGDVALNYGVYFEYKTQAWDLDRTDFKQGGTFDAQTRYVPRGMKTYSPDVWAKLGIGRVVVEAELAAQFGKVEHLDDAGLVGSADIRKFGGTGRATWKGLEGKLRLGFESGFASGDQWDNVVQGTTNIAGANALGSGTSDHVLKQFMMNREYKVDMILWRHLYGAVTNAAYVKPFLSYDLTKAIMFKVANISSFALNSVATPGNGTMYGTEFDADVGYAANGIFAGISYGVLFPFSAMAHPADDPNSTDKLGYGVGNTGDAGTSHTIQMRFVLGF
ncbi:MAG: TIGR04551 family protein [Proteobacteria bacterium]|nr:TIGR04551 family protein [Pseudomonadota bacterium]